MNDDYKGNNIYIRPADFSDLEEIQRIEIAAGLSRWSKADYAAEIGRLNSLFLVLIDNEMIKGFVLARLIILDKSSYSFTSGNEMEIYNIAVEEVARNRGFGALLLESVLREAKSREVSTVFLEVRKTNSTAQNFYVKNGFSVIGFRKNYYADPPEDALLMSLELSAS
jgi:ribosomal-protein-alanine N-acetyltransferase